MHRRYTLLYIYVVVLIAFILSACHRRTVFSYYGHPSSTAWEKNAPVAFSTNTLKDDGMYVEDVGVCINSDYPFKSLTLIIEQTRYPAYEIWSDTLNCELIDDAGYATGQGVSQFQYVFPLKKVQLHQGDSLAIAIRHDMKRELLPGVVNIGLWLNKE